MLWQPLITKINSSTTNKSLSRISSGDHKKTQQGVSNILLFYLYNRQIVHANDKQLYPNVYVLSMSTPYTHHEMNMPQICILILFFQSLFCYNSKILELISEQNLVLELTQENLIENSLQDCLPYILKAHGLCSTTLAYPK